MSRKEFLKQVRLLHPDKGGNKEDFQKYMADRRTDIFNQEDVFCTRNNIDRNDEFSMIFERIEEGVKIIEKVTYKKDNSIERIILEKIVLS